MAGQAAQARLSALEAERAREVETRNRTLEAQRQALASASALLDPAARNQRAKEIERFEIDLQRLNEDAGLVAWAGPALDITQEIVKRIDQP